MYLKEQEHTYEAEMVVMTLHAPPLCPEPREYEEYQKPHPSKFTQLFHCPTEDQDFEATFEVFASQNRRVSSVKIIGPAALSGPPLVRQGNSSRQRGWGAWSI